MVILIHVDPASCRSMQDEIELLNEKLEDMKAENRRLHDLYKNSGSQDDAKVIEKLKSDIIRLKGHLKVTRDNNGVLKSIVDGLEGKIEQLKMKESKLVSDLESCKSTDVDLIIAQRELKECNQDLEAEESRNRQYESGRTTCADKLGDQVQINRNLRAQNSNLSKSLDEARSSSSSNQRLAQRCQNQLEDEVAAKQNLQEKFESAYPSWTPTTAWSEWSYCSKSCWGIRKRFKISNNDVQIQACNQDSSCARTGKS